MPHLSHDPERPLDLVALAPLNPLRSYAGVKYLCDALADRGVALTLWANIPAAMLPEAADWRYPVHSFWSGISGRVPRLRYYSAWAQAFWLAYRGPRAVLTVDVGFMRELAWVKRLRPEMVLIQYCPELFTVEEQPQFRTRLRRYARVADVPDIVIDVEPQRAAYRQAHYSLSKEVLVIPNTLPRAEAPHRAPAGALARLAGCTLPTDKPILLYSGRGSLDRDWELLLNALAAMERKPFFLAFCYGEAAGIRALRTLCSARLGPEHVHIADAVPRQDLLSSIHEADAGFVYYRPSHSLNHRFAAPTKLYEYLAAGLPVVASNNPGLVTLVEEGGLGVCVRDESSAALTEAFERLLFSPAKLAAMRRAAEQRFAAELCYEVAAAPALEQIMAVLQRTRDAA